MKKILVILPNLPYPLNSGGNIGVFEMLNVLRFKTKLSIVVPSDDYSNLVILKEKWNNVKFYTYRKEFNIYYRTLTLLKKASLLILMKLLFKELDFNFSFLRNRTIRDSLLLNYINSDLIKVCNGLISNFEYDIIQIEFYKLLPLINFLPKGGNYFFVHHELRFIRVEREYSLFKESNNLDYYFLSLLRGIEIELLNKYRKIICLSMIDKDILSGLMNPSLLSVSPLTIKTNFSDNKQYIFDNKLFFIGGSGHYPNVDGLKWFIKECWSYVLDKYPNLTLEIIGKWDEKSINDLKKTKNIIFHGFVENLGDYFKNGILVVPIRIGSGMRMKIIDAVNYRIPFVSTKIGIEGIDLKNKIDCFVEDEPLEFVKRIFELIESENQRNLFRDNSCDRIREVYNHEELIATRLAVYNS